MRHRSDELCLPVHSPPVSPNVLTHTCITSSQSPPSLLLSVTPSAFHSSPDLRLTCFTNPFLHIVFLVPFRLLSWFFDLDWTKLAFAFALVSYFIFFFDFSYVCYRFSWPHSAFQSMLNSFFMSYRIVTKRLIFTKFLNKYGTTSNFRIPKTR